MLVSVFLMCLLSLANCGDDELTKQQKVTKLLTQNGGEWSPSAAAESITLDGIDVEEELFPGFAMQFTEEEILTSGDSPFWDELTGNNPMWRATDTWTFKDKNADVLIRGSDDLEITIVTITAEELIIQMEWDGEPTYESGRQMSLPGSYVFTLTKQ